MTLTTEQRERIARGLGFEQWADGIWRRESDGDSLGNADEIDTDPRFFGPLVQAFMRIDDSLVVSFDNECVDVVSVGAGNVIPIRDEGWPHNNTPESMQTALCEALLEVMPDA